MIDMQQLLSHIRSTYPTLTGGWDERAPEIITEAIILQQVAAPTFQEEARARLLESRFQALGLHDVTRDDLQNVYGRTPGGKAGPALLVSAHLDTVFPQGTPLEVRHDHASGRIYGPGLGDNSLGLAGMLALARVFSEAHFQPPTDIWWVGTVGEEGLGDLRGIRRACERLKGQIGAALILEGIGLGLVYNAGIGVRRLRVTSTGPGGHSWSEAHVPSAIHHLLRIGAHLVEQVTPLKQPRTTFNVGLIEGGTSINTRAPHASMSLDLRSTDRAALAEIEASVRGIISGYEQDAGLTVTTEVVGDRPSARLSESHPLVACTLRCLYELGHPCLAPDMGSTDANVPLALNIPTVCIGITTGGDSHTRSEYIETGPIPAGMQQIALVALTALHHMPGWSQWDATL